MAPRWAFQGKPRCATKSEGISFYSCHLHESGFQSARFLLRLAAYALMRMAQLTAGRGGFCLTQTLVPRSFVCTAIPNASDGSGLWREVESHPKFARHCYRSATTEVGSCNLILYLHRGILEIRVRNTLLLFLLRNKQAALFPV